MKMKLLAHAIATMGVLGSAVAFAADAPADTQLERVTITGSNIKRINKEGPTAVEVIKRADIEKTGASTVVELLSKLPSISVTLDGNDSASFAKGAASVSLRGLGEKYTLVLLNGRRLANYGFANGAENTFVDLNSLPLAAIETVEILRDGASAIYGADAVAGVINFKTRQNYQGLQVMSRVGVNQGGDNGLGNISVTGGFGDLEKDGHNLLLTMDLFHREPTQSEDHSNTRNHDHRSYGGSDGRQTEIPGFVRDYDAGGNGMPLPGCRNGFVGVNSTGDTTCITNPNSQLSPRQDRQGISAIFTQRLNGTDELFAELGFNHNVTSYLQGFPYFETGTNMLMKTAGSTNPGLNTLDPNVFTPGDRLQIFHRITENGPAKDTVTSNTERLVTGWRGTLGTWDTDASISLNQNKIRQERSNQLLKDKAHDALQAGVLGQAGGYDPFNPNNPSSVVSPLLVTTVRNATSRLNAFEWKMSNSELFSLPAGPVGFAWGYQLSRETMEDNPDPLSIAHNISNVGAVASSGARTSHSLYGEFNVPVLKQLEMQAALRGDHFSDFGNTVNPKLAFKFQPSKEVLLRTSASTSFKTPTLPEMYAFSQGYVTVADWASCVKLGYVGSQCAYNPKLYTVGNPNLKAEKSKNYSFGMVLQPTENLSGSLDWYMIDQKDTIQLLDPQYILDNEFNGYQALIGRDPVSAFRKSKGLNLGRINSITSSYTNVGKTVAQGFDLDINYLLPLGEFGKLKFRESHNHTLSFKQSKLPNSSTVEQVDSTGHPRWSNNFSTAYIRGDQQYMLTARSYASTKNNDDLTHSQDASQVGTRVPSYTVWDLNISLKPVKNLDVNLGVNNLFDKKAIYASTPNIDDFASSLADYTGRGYYASARYTFK